ncbi:hypothetical protein BKM31_44275 [[Actinomadura] parvosata subsp. kistnae]|uniref:DUF1275 family protein n=1 Tax=[Actinomadura] parvosata subsp. kistnae TaxID=1909395 RepID=A0A1V0ALM8_9ACTN|nr:YoaK family protein [Nonomuraea sp. ATCC 55076]AQZ71108.1 hypothetical protein BKM31_44275 [Nonomuraea sp. ATCC 55076]
MVRGAVFGLAFAAGAVDALSFLALGEVFTANMTGNVVLLGLALGSGRMAHLVGSGVAFAGFCAGLGAGFVLAGRVARGAAVVLVVEVLVLAGVAAGWAAQVPRLGLVAGSAVAMGLQSAVTRRAGGSGLSTTYVTGTVTGLAGQVVSMWGGGRDGGGGVVRPLGVVVALAAGAGLAALSLRLYEPAAPLIAPVAVAAAGWWWVRGSARR